MPDPSCTDASRIAAPRVSCRRPERCHAIAMSIAIAAVIRPSRALHLAQVALCVAVLACAAWSGPGIAGAFLLAAGVVGAASGRAFVKPARIDISAVGQIRLAVYHQRDAQHAGMGQSVRLLPGSTVWPGLLLLRLESEAGKAGRVYWLIVLPDSAALDVRRRLSLAVRAIAVNAAGDNGAAKKIL
ncbi:hypothetical protein [Pseudoduganella lutea]|uniref:Toxin CptA n=1 Tax=Pseudoduganella lutea TaxID=321985 RepID=A0A4P6L3D4_9BURK|nr:hypothetical protein [Pseudoduganella lutea]QBE65358.1 hypothetical protein EWM63_22140 [Pseudoduganella lutea]